MATQAQIDAHERYNAKAYDELKIRVPKGRKATLQGQAAESGLSLNEYINRLFAFYCGIDQKEWKCSADYAPRKQESGCIRIPALPGVQEMLSSIAHKHGLTLLGLFQQAIVNEVQRLQDMQGETDNEKQGDEAAGPQGRPAYDGDTFI